MGGFSLLHWVIILFIVVVLFGAGRLPKIGEGLGKGIKSFRDQMKGLNEEEEEKEDASPKKTKVVKGKVHREKLTAKTTKVAKSSPKGKKTKA